jgi:hypothetical protein
VAVERRLLPMAVKSIKQVRLGFVHELNNLWPYVLKCGIAALERLLT